MRDCVLVTGASGGIGFEICKMLLSNKENVIGNNSLLFCFINKYLNYKNQTLTPNLLKSSHP